MRLKLPYCLLFILSIVAGNTKGQDFIKEHYLFQQKVANGLVFDIHQDQMGFMWFATEHGLIRYDGTETRIYRQDPLDTFSVSSNVITALAEDSSGNLWVGTMFNGLNHFNRKTGRFTRFTFNGNPCSISGSKVNKILIARSGKIWASIEGKGLVSKERGESCFRWIQKPLLNTDYAEALSEDQNDVLFFGTYFGLNRENSKTGGFDSIPLKTKAGEPLRILKVLTHDRDGHLLIGTRNQGLFRLDEPDGQIQPLTLSSGEQDLTGVNNIWDVLSDSSGVVWVCTDAGLAVLEPSGHQSFYKNIEQSGLRRVLSAHKSRDGVVWLGTNSGVVVLAPKLKSFNLLRIQKSENPPVKRGVTVVMGSRSRKIWVGTLRGLYQYSTEELKYDQDFLSSYPSLKKLANANIASIFEDSRNHLWIGTITGFNSGFEVYEHNPAADVLTAHSMTCETFRVHVTYEVAEDGNGNLWFANGAGLVFHSVKNGGFKIYRMGEGPAHPSSNSINRLLVSNGMIWIGTQDGGLNKYDPEGQRFQHFPIQPGNVLALSDKRVLHIMEDRDKNLWLGTTGGLNHFNLEKNAFTHYFKNHGLPDDHINGIVQDLHGHLWMTSPDFLTRFNPDLQEFVSFDRLDGIEQSEFWDRASYRDDNGRVYFGGDDGLLVFDPDQIRTNPHVPSLVFTDLYLFNKKVSAGSPDGILKEELGVSPKIRLRYNQNVFSIHFTALSFIRPEKTQYQIIMEGFENDWQSIGGKREVTYTNLNPGQYIFRVKASNNDGVWNETGASLQLHVLSPWWSSSMAWLMYLVLLGLGILVIYRFQLSRQIQAMETRKWKELDAFKSRFFTNITHEFRTPLTLVLGPVEQALKDHSELGPPDLHLIRRNARRLLQLVNQLLNLGRLEAGKIRLNYGRRDAVEYIRFLVETFQSYASSKGIQLRFEYAWPSLYLDIDDEKLMEIFTNILSNAFKATPPGGTITVKLLDGSVPAGLSVKQLDIQITDTGPGISPDQLDRIFDRFYTQESSGSGGIGIGLSLAKELTEILEGKLMVESVLGQGTSFIIRLPVRQLSEVNTGPLPEKWANSENPVIPDHLPNLNPEDKNLPTVLVVEDHPEMAQFIRSSIQNQYQVRLASNGEDGLFKAIHEIPDLILSDIMMPELDGLGMIEKLKTNIHTSHIPVILVTARGDEDSRLDGLKHQADAYIIKPFNREELLVIMQNLLNYRNRLQQWYRQEYWSENKTKEPPPLPEEHEFIKKLRQQCEDHLTDSAFSIEKLCHAMGMSHSQAHRKTVALTGESIQKFVRKIRLEKAKDLLRTSSKTVSEITYETGFSEPAYFTKVFTQETGINPSEWRKQFRT